jgi:hypothetical protein
VTSDRLASLEERVRELHAAVRIIDRHRSEASDRLDGVENHLDAGGRRPGSAGSSRERPAEAARANTPGDGNRPVPARDAAGGASDADVASAVREAERDDDETEPRVSDDDILVV